ncbi:uncharacterized protein BCR38DRAFT_154453 [Pseudomassariella vexata]|uniref:Uncharacterized protein n=1 Tax=Pseudomassariella vexata TaxID=1141098 RepID=A0A1Y2E784_9PEZI|nr:uncharacterized protein BCR38DRAFT_154453 [Pseudomassariella vexata]ORY67297.1 hypothetical protein BCR38DRAFT_154453 [Pseudomassariella vexata]
MGSCWREAADRVVCARLQIRHFHPLGFHIFWPFIFSIWPPLRCCPQQMGTNCILFVTRIGEPRRLGVLFSSVGYKDTKKRATGISVRNWELYHRAAQLLGGRVPPPSGLSRRRRCHDGMYVSLMMEQQDRHQIDGTSIISVTVVSISLDLGYPELHHRHQLYCGVVVVDFGHHGP